MQEKTDEVGDYSLTESARGGRVACWLMLAALGPTMAFILAAAIVPMSLARALGSGSVISRGLGLGLGLAVYLVVLAIVYTALANRRDRA